MSFAHNIRFYRKKAQLTQIQLAEVLGISIATLRRWEAGETTPNIKMLEALAEHLGISPENIVETKKDILNNNATAKNSSGMLVIEADGKRIEIPPTEQGYKTFNEIIKNIFSAK